LGGVKASVRIQVESCEKDFETTLTMTERADAKVKCPQCGSMKATPQFTASTAKTSRKS